MLKLLNIISLLFLFSIFISAQSQPEDSPILHLKFDFGNGNLTEGFQIVKNTDMYNSVRGYGLIGEGEIISIEREDSKYLTSDFITSDKPFYFVVDLPEGNYEIKIGLGDITGKSLTTIKAEQRRLMIENLETKLGETITKTFWVNVRSPKINDTLEIRRKPREFSYVNWDDKLSLEFNNKRPCINSVEIKELKNSRTIFLAGNSTVVDQANEPWASWGQMITNFLKPEIVVANFAESGEALLSFQRENRLAKVLSLIKKDDYLFIEFAHNDQKPGSAHLEPFTTYKDELKYFINEARKKEAIPVLVTSMHRRNFDENGKIINTLGDYPEAVRHTAKETNTAIIDLNKMSKVLYETLGPINSKKAFVHYPAGTFPDQTEPLADDTHFNAYGAYQLAKCILQGIKNSDLDLKNYIKENFDEYNPSSPDKFEDFFWPMSPGFDLVKPEGN